jgi:hypothetical protein
MPTEISEIPSGPVSGLWLCSNQCCATSDFKRIRKRKRAVVSPFTVAGAVPELRRLPDYPNQ